MKEANLKPSPAEKSFVATVGKSRAQPAEGSAKLEVSELPGMRTDLDSYIDPTAPHGELARKYVDALIDQRRDDALALVAEEMAAGASLKEIYLHVFQTSQYEIGRRWQLNQISVAHEHYCTAATQAIMSHFYSELFSGTPKDRRVVAACVAGDFHEFGIRMVADFFEMEGWDSVYLGANTPTAGVVEMVEKHRPHVVALSVTIAAHLPALREVVEALRQSEAGKRAIILCGGYPFRAIPGLHEQYGADGAASDAQGAVELVCQLLEERGL